MKTPALEILHADEDLVVVNKPAGMLSIPDRFILDKPNLVQALQAQYGEIWVVHRLDRETSGIICFARNEAAHRHLNAQFQARTVDKIYAVLVDGRPLPPQGRIEKPIAPHPTLPGKMVVSPQGKYALTLYEVVDTFKAFSLVHANIRTGRTHQIRVHFTAIGHPLAVDPLYGKRRAFLLSELKRQNFNLSKLAEAERPLMERLTLHAARLALDHPRSGEKLQWDCSPPKDFRALLHQLEKWGR